MAVNPQKLLPPPSSALVKVGKIKTSKKSENNSTDSINTIDAIKKELEKIKENLEKIYSLVLDNNKLTEKDLEVKRLSAERLKFAEKEKRLETKDPEKKDERDDKSIPKLGIFDRINRFITFTLLGWVAVRLVKYLPKLLEFSKNLLPVMEFFSSFTANFFKGVVDFIDFGYNAYDKVKDFVKGIGGEPFEKAFDNFSSNLNKFVNLAIIAGIATSGGTDFGLGKKPGKLGSGLGGGSSQKLTIQERVKNSRIRDIQRKYGPSARKIYENALNNGKTPQQAEAAVRKGIKKGVSIRPGADSLSAKTAKKGSVLSRGVGKSVNRLSTKVLGKAGKKLVGKAFGKIPIIGGLVSFIISVLSGEPVGRAAAKAVGFSIGSALGTFIPVPFVGTILGGMLGDIVGGALYDTLVSNKKEETPEVVAKRGGGRVKSNSTLETFNQDKKSKILYPGQSVLQKGTRERIIDHTGIDPIESRNTGGFNKENIESRNTGGLLGFNKVFNKENIESRNTGGFNKENIESRNTGGLLGFNKGNIESRNTGGFNKENNNSNITRGGKKVGGPVQRKVRRVVKRIVTPPKSTPIAAGKSVGGKEKLKGLFPEPPQGQVGKSMDPYGYTTGTSEKLGQIPFLGPLFNIFGKTLLGDLPNKSDYQKVGMGLGAWINTAVSQGQLQGNIVSAFSDGGMIEGFGRSDISGWVEKSVEELVKNKVTEAINELKRNLGLKPLQENVTGVTGPEDFAGELGSASDAVGGARLLMEAGFPMLAAAILSGNIQAESAWKGQRTPWILNDGAGINKGLISWNRTRITNAEKFLGKPLETASNAEQIKWIKEELRQYGLLDKFMDPNRTESQLKSDSYKYIGWGIEGDRWAQSSRIFAALQKGERGTFEPAKSSSGRPSRGSLSSVLPRGNPVPSSSFGWRWGRMHRGQDIGVDANSPVNAIEDGKVIDIYKNFGGWGDAVVVQHSDGSKNIYGHVIGNVSANSKVKRGQGIAKVKYWPNAYGNKDNTHLHFERVDSNGQHIDPKKYLGLQGGGIIGKNIKSIQTQASYDDGQPVLMVMAIQPILIKEQNPMRTGGTKIAFIGGVNSNNNNSSLFVG
jgi:murein DD-endopeptidase MepM/ murein hydrolase activator NlpD